MRRERLVAIEKPAEGENRDAGKTFIVREVDAVQAEEWGLRAMMALGTSGVVVPPELAPLGILAIPIIGYQAFMGSKEQAVIPLWREMLTECVFLKQSAEIRQPFSRQLVEEVSTLLALRQAIMELHTGFTLAELVSRFGSMSSALLKANSSLTQDGQ